ncbi:MAG: hypothetical protein Q4A66_13345, partial [Eubacteriales bacterium]|nr:hypothetical protein [Eubacteriales bacterium]
MLSDLTYLSYPLPPDVRRLFEAGDFERMNRVIQSRIADPRTPKCLHERLRFQQHIAALTPLYYPYTREEILAKLQAKVKDFKDEEIDALLDDGTLDWRYIDGVVYFRANCISNLLKTRPEYEARAIDPAPHRSRDLDEIIARMKANGGVKARFELREEMTISSDRL